MPALIVHVKQSYKKELSKNIDNFCPFILCEQNPIIYYLKSYFFLQATNSAQSRYYCGEPTHISNAKHNGSDEQVSKKMQSFIFKLII
jgi:hypothetical protein